MEAPSSQPLNLYYTSQNQLGGLRNIAWSPHTNWLAFGAADGTVQLCDVVGKDQQTATNTLQNAGFQVQMITVPASDPSQNGIVVDEQPAAGTRAPDGSTVTIYVGSSG